MGFGRAARLEHPSCHLLPSQTVVVDGRPTYHLRPTTYQKGGVVTDKIVILVTAASLRECRKIARHLVDARLAACVNITQPIQSIYRWKGKLADEKEFLLLIKSARELFDEIRSEILKIHSSATPEIICLPIVEGSPDYLQWVGDSVKPTQA